MVGGSNYQEKNYLLLSKTSGGGGGGGEWVNASPAYIYTRVCTYGSTKGRQAKTKNGLYLYTYDCITYLM